MAMRGRAAGLVKVPDYRETAAKVCLVRAPYTVMVGFRLLQRLLSFFAACPCTPNLLRSPIPRLT
jgi:hypothetical protein